MGRYRPVPTKGKLADVAADCYAELESLREEVESVVDEASGSNRENTQRVQTLSETLDALQNSSCDDIPNFPESVKELEVSYTEHKVIRGRYGKSREMRCTDALAGITASYEALREYCDDQETKTEESGRLHDQEALNGIREIADSMEELVNDLESCEWPGMYG